jgi:hypothetical protein
MQNPLALWLLRLLPLLPLPSLLLECQTWRAGTRYLPQLLLMWENRSMWAT